jgi:hypothetical protein
MTAREAVEEVVRVARANNVYINDEAISRCIAKLEGDPEMIAAFYETGLRMAHGSTLFTFYV